MSSPRVYLISQDGEILGHFTEPQVREALGTGFLSLEDLGWASGMAEWKELGELFPRAGAGMHGVKGEGKVGAEGGPRELVSPGTAYRCLLNVGMETGREAKGAEEARTRVMGRQREAAKAGAQETAPVPTKTPAVSEPVSVSESAAVATPANADGEVLPPPPLPAPDPLALVPDEPPPPLPKRYLPEVKETFVPVQRRRRKRWGLVVAVMMLLLLLGGGGYVWQRVQPREAKAMWMRVKGWGEEAKLYVPPLELPWKKG